MSLSTDEFRGVVQISLRGRKRFVPLSGEPMAVELAKDMEHKAFVSKRNARAHENRKKNPARLAARQRGIAEWRRQNPMAVKSYRAAWVMRNEELHKKIQRDSAKRGYKPKGLARGERSPFAKLNAEKVLQIRQRYAEGGVSMSALGRGYGVAFSSIRKIIRREMWAHV
jgi:hypothetical protein